MLLGVGKKEKTIAGHLQGSARHRHHSGLSPNRQSKRKRSTGKALALSGAQTDFFSAVAASHYHTEAVRVLVIWE
jgi:hypothetical protein